MQWDLFEKQGFPGIFFSRQKDASHPLQKKKNRADKTARFLSVIQGKNVASGQITAILSKEIFDLAMRCCRGNRDNIKAQKEPPAW